MPVGIKSFDKSGVLTGVVSPFSGAVFVWTTYLTGHKPALSLVLPLSRLWGYVHD